MSDNGIYKHIEESNLPELPVRELRELLELPMQISPDDKLWQILPGGDWMRIN